MRYKLPDNRVIEQTAGFEFDGLYYSPNPRRTGAELEAIGAVEVPEPPPPPQVDPRFYYVSQIGDPVPRPIEEVRKALKTQVAAERWQLEQAGVEWNGHKVQTDRESRANYVGLVQAVGLNLRVENGIYKFIDGPAPLANADVVPLALAVAAYVQGLFNREAEIATQIDALENVAAAEVFTWSFSE